MTDRPRQGELTWSMSTLRWQQSTRERARRTGRRRAAPSCRRCRRATRRPIDDVWDAVTSGERIPRWFRRSRATCGSAADTSSRATPAARCWSARPRTTARAHYRVTWEYGGGGDRGSIVRLAAIGDDETTRRARAHVARVATSRRRFWDQFGPGATGVGWDGGMLGLALHLSSAVRRRPRGRPNPGRSATRARRSTAERPTRGRRARRRRGAIRTPLRERPTRRSASTPGSHDARSRRPDTGPSIDPRRSGGSIVEETGAPAPRRRQRRTRSMTLFDGITATHRRDSPDSNVNILERDGDDPSTPPERTVVLIHGNVSSSLFWQELMQDLPSDLRVIAIDLRGYRRHRARARSTRLAACATSATTSAATLEALGIPTAHLVGLVDGRRRRHAVRARSPRAEPHAQSPISPYGFGGTRRDGTRLTDDDAGTGGGAANPDFVQRLIDHDTIDDAPTSPRSVFRSGYVAAGYTTEHEDVWVESMLIDLDGDRQLSRRLAWRARTGPASRRARSACSTRWLRSTSTCRASSTSTRSRRSLWIHGTARRDRLGHLVLRLQLPRAARHRPRLAGRRGRSAAGDGVADPRRAGRVRGGGRRGHRDRARGRRAHRPPRARRRSSATRCCR